MAQFATSAVTEGELLNGVARHRERVSAQGLGPVPGIMGRCGRRWKRKGRRIGNPDMMIGAHALALGAVLVTNDQAFSRIKGLKIESA
ncbi:MAG: PIN domain-containing protein [Bryobacteraceae bacterium]